MTITLRDYQVEALEAERLHRIESPAETRLAIVLATGLGKSLVIAERAIRYLDSFEGAGNRVLVLVHTDAIAQGVEDTIREMARPHDFTVGVVKADRDEVGADIVVGSVQTLTRVERRARLTDVGLVMVDECHHATAASYQDIMMWFGCFAGSRSDDPHYPDHYIPTTPALGLTATLERGDGQSLGGVWQDVAYTRGTSWAVRRGHLVQPVGYRVEIPGMALRSTESATLQDIALVQSLAPAVIVREWLDKAAGRPTVAFMPLVRSAHALAAEFVAAGVPAAVVWGGQGEAARAAVMDAYADGSVTVLVNAMALTEGWDPPKKRRVTCVIIGRPTKSRTLFIQMAGRGLRPDPFRPVEDQDCILLVVADATTDMCTVADLSDRPLDRKTQGALTAMEDAFDIGAGLEDPEHVWLGQVDAKAFDPLVSRSRKVWARTARGVPFIPLADRRYVFIVGTKVFYHRVEGSKAHVTGRAEAPDLELAMGWAEGLAEDLGGDLGRLVADKGRAWRKTVPSEVMIARAAQLGLQAEVDKIMASRAGGKAGKLSDAITKVLASRALDKFAERITA